MFVQFCFELEKGKLRNKSESQGSQENGVACKKITSSSRPERSKKKLTSTFNYSLYEDIRYKSAERP